MDRKIKFGEMVEYYMRLNNLTMKELGSKVGRGESTVSMWISNKSTPPMGIVQKLADYFGVSTDTMIYGFDENSKVIEIPDSNSTITSLSITQPTYPQERLKNCLIVNPMQSYMFLLNIK